MVTAATAAAAQGETIEFGVSTAIIRHLIESQAGSVEKAVLEGVMNGIDAGATRIDVRFEGPGKVVIEDNGSGFESRADIQQHFAIFGFDHSTAAEAARDRTFGRFGLGRGQLMAFARTVWETNQFELQVDIRGKDLAFDLVEHPAPTVYGCRITAHLYDKLSNDARLVTKNEIKKLTRYSPVAIYIDGERANEDLDKVKWTQVTDEFYWREKPNSSRGVEIFNLGVFVTEVPHSNLGVSGELVSRKGHEFKLNMARNDVLQSSCKTWRKARKLLAVASERRRRSTKLNDADRIAIARGLIARDLEPWEYYSKGILKDVQGRPLSPKALHQAPGSQVAVAPEAHSNAGEAAMRAKVAVVLAPDVLDWYSAADTEALLETMGGMWTSARRCQAIAFEELEKAFDDEYRIIVPANYTKTETAALKALNSGNWSLHKEIETALRGTGREYGNPRNIMLGASGRAHGWTDGESYIVIDKGYLARQLKRGVGGFFNIHSLLLHEYIHVANSGNDHAHPPEFYEQFERVVRHEYFDEFKLVQRAYMQYLKERDKLGLMETRGIMRTLDMFEELAPAS